MSEKIVLIGAGSVMFATGLISDLVAGGAEASLALVDSDPAALETVERLARRMAGSSTAQKANARLEISAHTDRRAALQNATVVICMIGVGGRRAWEQDVLIPRKYGIFMPVGDSTGPGGASRALRMIPAMVDIANDVLDLAPQALFFNYGNPMAATCRGVRKATGANVIGLCHGVFHIAGQLAQLLEVAPRDFSYAAVGLNHLTWFVAANVRGCDAMPHLREIAEKQVSRKPSPELGMHFAEAGNADIGKINHDPFCWRLMQIFGAFPAPSDRHVTECFPQCFPQGEYFGKRLGVDAYSFEKTIAHGDLLYERMREEAFSAQPPSEEYFARGGGEHEQLMEIVACIRSGQSKIFSANLPNSGQSSQLSPEVVLEGPAVTTSDGLCALGQPRLPEAIAGLLNMRCAWIETVVDAALEGSREKFIQALALDGSLRCLDDAPSLADELLAAQAAYLPQFPQQA